MTTTVLYNQTKNRKVYQTKVVDSDSDSDSDIESKSNQNNISNDEIITINQDQSNPILTDIRQWQKIIGDYNLTEISDIIEQLIIQSNEHSTDLQIKQCLTDAYQYQFQQSVQERKKIMVKRDLNVDQFGNRIRVDYDKSDPDEQYKIVKDGHIRCQNESNKPKPKSKPSPKNWGTKRLQPTVNLPNPNQPDPMLWLLPK